jgi:hypothetical protein
LSPRGPGKPRGPTRPGTPLLPGGPSSPYKATTGTIRAISAYTKLHTSVQTAHK